MITKIQYWFDYSALQIQQRKIMLTQWFHFLTEVKREGAENFIIRAEIILILILTIFF